MTPRPFWPLLWGLCLLLGGCGGPDAAAPRPAPVAQAIDGWPENPFTQSVPAPEAGAADYQLVDEAMGYCAVFYRDITLEEGKAYLEALQAAGFTELARSEEPPAGGALLQKEGLQLSVSIAEGSLGIYLRRDGAAPAAGAGG